MDQLSGIDKVSIKSPTYMPLPDEFEPYVEDQDPNNPKDISAAEHAKSRIVRQPTYYGATTNKTSTRPKTTHEFHNSGHR
jgi:hypothetical protein